MVQEIVLPVPMAADGAKKIAHNIKTGKSIDFCGANVLPFLPTKQRQYTSFQRRKWLPRKKYTIADTTL